MTDPLLRYLHSRLPASNHLLNYLGYLSQLRSLVSIDSELLDVELPMLHATSIRHYLLRHNCQIPFAV